MTTSKHRVRDIPAHPDTLLTVLRQEHPELPGWAWRIISRYRPRTSAVQWEAVRPMVLETAVRVNPATYGQARRLLSMTARFACWFWATTGTPPSQEGYFTDRAVWRYVQSTLAHHSLQYRWGVVRQLRVLARLSGHDVHHHPAPAPTRLAPPFTNSQLALLYTWATGQPTRHARRNAATILALAAGAGLTSAEIAETTAADLDRDEAGILWITVRGLHPRTIPVLTTWQSLLGQARGGLPLRQRLFTGYRLDEYPPHAIGSFLTLHPAPIRPTVTRLRTGWICRQLATNMPLSVLLEASGLADLGGLTKYLAFLPATSIREHAALLAGRNQ